MRGTALQMFHVPHLVRFVTLIYSFQMVTSICETPIVQLTQIRCISSLHSLLPISTTILAVNESLVQAGINACFKDEAGDAAVAEISRFLQEVAEKVTRKAVGED